ncbi:HP0495 family protein [Brackiella oedipodis]|uniref:HP0495 family protein n=1 Tax=Brackiella oedipodis TaxID=124225 RepID=UPI00048E3880|nr:DUF493 family protein [Brackiella oedipodis]
MAQTPHDIPPEESLIEYPCYFPIKVMGHNEPHLAQHLTEIVREFVPDFDPDTIVIRPSSKGNYVGLTFTVYVTSREQLDTIYRSLHAHHLVKVVL